MGSSFLNAIEECWRQGKYNILSNYYSSFSLVKQAISDYYRKRRFNLDAVLTQIGYTFNYTHGLHFSAYSYCV